MSKEESTELKADSSPGSLREVRYSLKELLQKMEHERTDSMIAREIVDQSEISDLFKSKSTKRGSSEKK